MNVAYCIVCHKFTPVLEELVAGLEEGDDVFVHVDAKVDIGQFEPLQGRVNFIENRVRVTWGRYSQIEATLRLLDATREVSCDYVALISGDTLPLLPSAELKKRLWLDRGCEYLNIERLLPAHLRRLRYRYPADDTRQRGFWGKAFYSVQRRLRLLPRNRWFGALPPLAFGSNWFVITPSLREYIFDFLGQNPEYVEAFRHSHCGDELFFATIAMGSPFAERLTRRKFFYIDWRTGPGHPRVLDESDFGRIAAAMADNDQLFFARKFADDLDLNEYKALINR